MKSQIQSYLRFAASKQRDTEQIGSFLATFSVHSDNPFLNYAIPDDNALLNIEHELEGLTGEMYGDVKILKRPIN